MTPIKPIDFGKSGPKVSNLHKGLLFLIINQDGISPGDRESLQEQLAPDVRKQFFGEATRRLLGMWQVLLKQRTDLPKSLADKVRSLPMTPTGGTGQLDDITAEALNWVLRKMGALAK
jgi:hypothetical protein